MVGVKLGEAIIVGDPHSIELRSPGPDAAAVYDRDIALGLLYEDKASGEEHYVVRYSAGMRSIACRNSSRL